MRFNSSIAPANRPCPSWPAAAMLCWSPLHWWVCLTFSLRERKSRRFRICAARPLGSALWPGCHTGCSKCSRKNLTCRISRYGLSAGASRSATAPCSRELSKPRRSPRLWMRAAKRMASTCFTSFPISLYSSLHTSSKSLRERRALVQKMVAAFAEAVRFVEDNPDKAKASVSKVLRFKDEHVLQASYDAYAKRLINRRMIVPVNSVTEGVEIGRESGTKVTKKATELLDNSFAENLEKSGFF